MKQFLHDILALPERVWLALIIWGVLFGPIVLVVFWARLKDVTGRLSDDEDHTESVAEGS